MKIYFCDLCDQSIPLSDITEGRATTVKGKVLCTQCVPQPPAAGGVSVPPAGGAAALEPGAARRAAGGPKLALSPALLALTLVSFVIALGAAALAGFAYARLRDLEGEGSQERATILGRVDRLQEDLGDVHGTLGELDRRLGDAASRTDLQGVSAQLDGLRKLQEEEGRQRTAALAQLAAKQADQAREITALGGLDGRLQVLAEKMELDTKTLFGRLASLEKQLLEGAASGPARPGPVAPANPARDEPPPVKETLPPAVQEQLDKLAKGDISERWVALTELTKLRDLRAAPRVVPYLKDEDPFVRHAAAQFLGEVEARTAVGELVDALGDDEAFVRDGVFLALRKITRQNLKFDAHAPPEQRKKAREKWSEWWKTNQDKFLAESER